MQGDLADDVFLGLLKRMSQSIAAKNTNKESKEPTK